ncbi:nuclear condensin complex subunit [Diplodia corticola]|uniref:Nuclear condensin complex subunit n=1 Tax=Diplodia corticola TaxID=236234 RepID=A0A1J9QVI4_9PEZI|nr:nuclear condensin complex subunit [Diplodia corticola]OJD32998.1 nuclear condensin complex subunit [Diplodia corticola]
MPGRVADRRRARASGAAGAAKPAATARSRNSRATRSNAVEIPDEGEPTSLRDHVCRIFGDAQRTTATQRKLVVQLRKVQEACCYEPVKPKKQQSDEDFGEEDFTTEVGRCLLRVLPVKKSEPVGDRVIKFVALFLKHSSDKDNQIAHEADPDESTFPSTPSSRLTSYLLRALIPLLTAKDKVVRFRSTQIISHILNTLDSIDDELFPLIRLGLLKRLQDKEAQVRVQAILGLGRLADGDDEEDEDSDDEDSAKGLLVRLLNALQNDPAAEVRRSLLLNLPLTPTTLPYLLERARDLDPATRRVLYSRLLPACGDFRHLSLTHREKLLRWGLRDRDENVRKATARLFRERWIEDCAGVPEATQDSNSAVKQLSKPSFDALMELLERIDVSNSGIEGGVAHDAMKEFWDGRPDYCEQISFEDSFWDDLAPESAFIARSFNDFCRNSGDSRLQTILEDKMPEVTKYGYLIQKHIQKLIQGVQKVAEDDDPEVEEETVQQEFCVEQLFHIALTLDYTDEIGRRKMFSTMREALAIPELPEECTKLAAEILRTVCGDNVAGEREFCGIVLEAIADVHDTILGDELDEADAESFHSARSDLNEEHEESSMRDKLKKKNPDMTEEDLDSAEEERAVREIMVNMKCLHIAQCLLQNVQCELESNSALITMLNNLVVPAVRSQEAPIRERGFVCLGLCCLLSKNIAQENLALFLHCFAKGHEALQTIALQIITDILTTHPQLLAPPADADASELNPPANPLLKLIYKMFFKAIRADDPGVATTGVVAASKLMLLNILRDTDLLKALTIAYFNPESLHNPGLRQALAYFLPVYCHSSTDHAERMASITVSVVHALRGVQEELEEEDVEMVGIGVIGSQLVDWTDGRKIVGTDQSNGRKLPTGEPIMVLPGDAHLLLANDLLEKILTPGTTRDEKKVYVSMLGKVHVHPSSSPKKIETVNDLVPESLDSRLASTDVTARNAFTKFANALAKLSAPSEKPDNSGTVGPDADEAEPDKEDDGNATVNEEAASVADATEAEAPSVAGDVDEMSVVEEEGEETKEDVEEDKDDTVVQDARPVPLSIEEQIQMQLQDETMADVDAEGTVMPPGDEMDVDEEDDDEQQEEEEEEGEEEKGDDEEDDEEETVVKPPTPTPPPQPQPKRRGRKKKEPEPEPEPEPEVEPATKVKLEEEEMELDEEQPKLKRRGRPPGSGKKAAAAGESSAEKKKRTPGSGKKAAAAAAGESSAEKKRRTPAKRASASRATTAEQDEGAGPRRSRGRPRKAAPKDVVDDLLESDDE